MSRSARIGLLVLAALTVAVAIVLASPEDSSDKADDLSRETGPATPGPADDEPPTATAESALPPPPAEIRLRGGEVRGGVQRIAARSSRTVRFVVFSDAPAEIHLHGYEIEKRAAPGKPARFRLETDLEGVFEIESHAAEDAGGEALIARLVVEP